MRQSTDQRRWTGRPPEDVYSPSGVLTGVSMALFDTLLYPGRVVAARCPGKSWMIGSDLYGDLDMRSHIKGTCSCDDVPLFVITRRGLGLLSRRYEAMTGLGLLVHFHVPVESAARSVNFGLPSRRYLVTPEVGAMGRELYRHDETVYWTVSESWRQLTGLFDGFPHPDSRRTVSAGVLADWIRQISAAVGCDVAVKESAMLWTRAVCYRPRLWEAYLVHSLLLAREMSLCRHMTCELSVMDGTDGGLLAVRMEFPMIQSPADGLSDTSDVSDTADSGWDMSVDRAEYSLRFMEMAVGRNGGCATHQVSPVYPAPQDTHILCRDVTLDMCFLQDPDREPEGDVKTHISMKM